MEVSGKQKSGPTTSKRQAKDKKRKVHFAAERKVIYPPNYPEGPIDEDRLWYNSEDYKQFRKDRNDTLRLLRSFRKGNDRFGPDDRYTTSRGLEPHLYRSSLRHHYHLLVLKEQHRQRSTGTSFDPVSIQKLTAPMSAWALGRAQRMASFEIGLYEL